MFGRKKAAKKAPARKRARRVVEDQPLVTLIRDTPLRNGTNKIKVPESQVAANEKKGWYRA